MVICQVVLIGRTAPTATGYAEIPFSGKCKVKLVQYMMYFGSLTGAVGNNMIFLLSSPQLINNTPNSNIILMNNLNPLLYNTPGGGGRLDNTSGSYYGDQFVLNDVMLSGRLDITISRLSNANINTNHYVILTFDIEYME